MPTTVDGFSYPADSPLATAHQAISEMLQEAKTARGSVFSGWQFKPGSTRAGKELLAATQEEQVDCLSAALDQMLFFARPQRDDELGIAILRFGGIAFDNWSGGSLGELEHLYKLIGGLKKLVSQLLTRSLPLTEEHVTRLLILLRMAAVDQHERGIPFASSIGAIERYVAEHGMSEQMITVAESVITALKQPRGDWFQGESSEDRKHRQRLEKLIPGKSKLLIRAGEAWSDQALSDLKSLPQALQNAWAVFISHCLTATASKPTKKFIQYAGELLEPIGEDAFTQMMNSWIPLLGQPRTEPLTHRGAWAVTDPLLIEEEHQDLWKGLAWSFGAFSDSRLTKLLGDLADQMYYKIRNYGARSTKVGNACVSILGMKSDAEAVVQLERLKSKIKKPSLKKQIEKAIEAAAENRGLSTEDLAEISVPTLGFTAIGVAEQTLGDVVARSEIVNSRTINTEYLKPDGKIQKTVPKPIKEEFPEDVKALKANTKEAIKLLQVHRNRLEQSYLTDRSWTYSQWKERYLDHPLLGWLTRKLIWTVDRETSEQQFGLLNETFVDSQSKPISTPDQNDLIRLWHPIHSETEEIQAWRCWLDETKTQQPFKQAHREIYRLSPQEQTTKTYSNRMAGHIMRQHQFAALCEERGWKYRVQGAWDSHNIPTRPLPEHDLRVEFWVESVTAETTAAGIFNFVSTDRVLFYRGQSQAPLSLQDVPEVVFSEIMRDVDLFVGVASVGNDPNWTNRGEHPQFNQYWNQYSFGDLSHSARTRHDVLSVLIPRLKIADRCDLNDRFLIIKGDLRTYKIHLGSSNVLMEPDDEYLCIPNQSSSKSKTDDLNIPFEDDNTLSLILQKAFMLANDKSIKDQAVLDQINP